MPVHDQYIVTMTVTSNSSTRVGSTRASMPRATPGCPLIKPARFERQDHLMNARRCDEKIMPDAGLRRRPPMEVGVRVDVGVERKPSRMR
jgi:hypothetical protein